MVEPLSIQKGQRAKTVRILRVNRVQEPPKPLGADLDGAALVLEHRARLDADPVAKAPKGQPGSLPKLFEVWPDHRPSCVCSGHKVPCVPIGNKAGFVLCGYTQPMSTLLSQLRERREHLGMTLRDLAPQMGVKYSALAKWERGRVDVTLVRMQAWAETLGVRLALVDADSEALPLPEGLSPAKRALVFAMIESLGSISDGDAAVLRRQVIALASS